MAGKMKNIAAGCAFAILLAPLAFIGALALVNPDLLELIAWYALWTVAGVAGVAFLITITVMEHRRERQDRTMQDGAWRLLKYRYREWNKDVPWPIALFEYFVGHPGELDRNRIEAPAYVLKHGRVIEHIPACGYEMQHAYNVTVEHTNIFRSMFPGHSANTNMFGRDAEVPKIQARALTPRTERPQITGPVAEPIEDGQFRPAMPATLSEALAAHRGPDLLLGQSRTGERALWQPQSDPHLGVWGKSGGGKTTRLGLSLAICQIKMGWRVLIIDPEQEGDKPTGHWGQLAPWAQVVGPGEPGCSLWDELMQWYERRWKSVADAGASDAWHMPEGKALRPLAVHFDELSRWRMMAQKRGGTWAKYASQVDDHLSEIGMRGRKRGVHMTLYGQLPGELPEAVAGSLTNLTFRQPDNQGNKVGYWAAHQLAQGEFAYNGKVYQSFSGLLEAPAILGNREAPKGILREGADRSVSVRSGEGECIDVDPTPYTPPTERPNDRTIGVEKPTNTELQRMVWNWRSAHPNGTQAELRTNFAAQGIEISKSWAHECWHKWPGSSLAEQLMAQGINLADVRLKKDGQRLGMDISYSGAD